MSIARVLATCAIFCFTCCHAPPETPAQRGVYSSEQIRLLEQRGANGDRAALQSLWTDYLIAIDNRNADRILQMRLRLHEQQAMHIAFVRNIYAGREAQNCDTGERYLESARHWMRLSHALRPDTILLHSRERKLATARQYMVCRERESDGDKLDYNSFRDVLADE